MGCEGSIGGSKSHWDPSKSIETIAAREGKSGRSIRMKLSLAFLAPDIIKAGIEGRLPRGFGVTRLLICRWRWLSGSIWGSKLNPTVT
jgi:hypothetical protein